MAPRDRTAELHSIVNRYKATTGAAARPSPATGRVSTLNAAAQRFTEAAQDFSRDLAATSLSLANLAKLIQQQTVFDDQASEIASLTSIIKSRLSKMHDDLTALAEMRAEAGSSSNHHQGQKHTEAVLTTLRTRLVDTSQNFKTILQRRTKKIRETASRREQLTVDKPASFESALFQQQQHYGTDQSQQQLAAQNPMQYYRARYDAVRQIETAVHEVGEMFQDFTRLVHEQETTIVRIDADVEESLGYVNAGSGELMKYIASLSSNRGMILKIFAVLFVFLLFFGFVVVR